MTTLNKTHIIASLVLLITFFLPWVVWKDASLSGNDMPVGQFFAAAREKFGVDNPFPQFSIVFKIFWLIPAAAVVVIAFVLLTKNTFWLAAAAGLLSLSLVLVYFLFSNNLVNQLGVSKSVWSMVKPWLFIQALAAVTIVLSAGEEKWLLKSGLILVTASATFFGFNMISKQVEKKIMEETYESTDNVKTDFTLGANDLLKEFMANDSAANKKYREKVLVVKGASGDVEIKTDSTVIIKFSESTGSYIVFSLDKDQFEKAKNIKAGDAVSLKGSCSGSVYSEILSTTSISFKRVIINNK